MTATFGKLRTESLSLSSGLNVLEMPNESGKSTWCAFLLAMFYGVDTSERESRNNLPFKKHYAPWSGIAMEGSISLEHEGRRITIERTSLPRAPMSVFRAYDTESGLPIEELTAQNCGQTLLGVPRQVFERSAFLRQDSISIQMDSSLEQRLESLVTTGDETISYQDAERLLRERRNRCRHNKTGLIPQIEASMQTVIEKINKLDLLHESIAQSRLEEQQLRNQIGSLRLQLSSLQAKQARERQEQLELAKIKAEESSIAAQKLEKSCASIPSIPVLQNWENELHRLQSERQTLYIDMQCLPQEPPPPTLPKALQDLSDEEMIRKSTVDASHMRLLQAKKKPTLLLSAIFTLLFLSLGISFWVGNRSTLAVIFSAIAVLVVLIGIFVYSIKIQRWNEFQDELNLLYFNYGVKTPSEVENCCDLCREACNNWNNDKAARTFELNRLNERKSALEHECDSFLSVLNTQLMVHTSLEDAASQIHAAIEHRLAFENAYRDAVQNRSNYECLQKAFSPLPIPTDPQVAVPESATVSSLQAEIYSKESELQHIRSSLDKELGQCSTLGDPTELEAKKQQLQSRLDELNREYDALSIALTAIGKANEVLQNRFSPKLTSLAAQYLNHLTDGAYSQLMLDHNLRPSLYPSDICTSRDAEYFSSGTKDQLYLAVRLALSKLLVPEAPLILDDALVRFDDERLKKALDVLQTESKSRQVLLFTCQGRENSTMNSNS